MRLFSSHNTQKGFSFIELAVVLTIFGVLSGVVLFRFSDFSAAVSLNNLARDIALEIKDAQTSAISGKTAGGAAVPAYGIHFSISGARATDSAKTINPSRQRFNYFADENNSATYNGASELIRTVQITTRDFIDSVCTYASAMTANCTTRTSGSFSMVFTRPYPDATLLFESASQVAMDIVIKSAVTGQTKTITVTKAGQIRVQ